MRWQDHGNGTFCLNIGWALVITLYPVDTYWVLQCPDVNAHDVVLISNVSGQEAKAAAVAYVRQRLERMSKALDSYEQEAQPCTSAG